MKPPIHRKLKLEAQILRTLSPAALALVGGADAQPVKHVPSWTSCHKP
jgi:hypothetical protein